MMSSYGDDESPPLSRQNSFQLRAETPDIIEPTDEFTSPTAGGGFNLADELAMAEESDGENTGFLSPPKVRGLGNRTSDYEGSEYGDIDDDSDGYLSDHVDLNELQLQLLVEKVGAGRGGNAVSLFVSDLRGMRGQMDVENLTRRLITMQKSLASALDHHQRILRDIPVLSPVLLQDDTFLSLLTNLTLPPPAPISHLLSDSSVDLTGLSDTLAMARQEQLQITRKLRSVKDAWMERKDEWQVMDERMAWLAENDSPLRRAKGSCAREVHGVVRGFDKVLGGMEREMYHLLTRVF